MAAWVLERIDLTGNTDDREPAAYLMREYLDWMDDTYGRTSQKTMPRATPNQLAEGLKSRGATKKRTKHGNVWMGLKLRSFMEEPEEGDALPKLAN
jgi:hypothetical protein